MEYSVATKSKTNPNYSRIYRNKTYFNQINPKMLCIEREISKYPSSRIWILRRNRLQVQDSLFQSIELVFHLKKKKKWVKKSTMSTFFQKKRKKKKKLFWMVYIGGKSVAINEKIFPDELTDRSCWNRKPNAEPYQPSPKHLSSFRLCTSHSPKHVFLGQKFYDEKF